jgi:glutathione S-transferase
MSGVVLTYFPMKGRAESIKIALRLAHIPFEFKGIDNWPVMKAEGLKSGVLPFGQVPLLHIDDMDLVQSMTILRYISDNYLEKVGCPKLRAHIDMMAEGWNDLLNKFYGFLFVNKDGLAGFMDGECKTQLGYLENLHKLNKTPFMASEKPSVADAIAFALVCQLKGVKSDILDDFEDLQKWEKKMSALEELKDL